VEIVYAGNGLQSSKENMKRAQLPEKIAKGECSFPKGICSVGEMKWLSKTCISVSIHKVC